MILSHDRLKQIVTDIFAAAGCGPPEHERIAHYLVESNLVGHDSHGVIRVKFYIDWLRAGKVLANRSLEVVFENDALAVVDGQFGFGQVMGEEAIKVGHFQGVAQAGRGRGGAAKLGPSLAASVIAGVEMAAHAGKVSLHFVNTSGGGILVAPFGGSHRRLSANPLAAWRTCWRTATPDLSLTCRLARSPRARSRSRSTRV